MQLAAFTHDGVFEQLKSEWNQLLQQSTSNSVFSTWEWQSTWWEAYHPGELWVLTCRDDTDHLIGIAPCFISETDAGRALTLIGCVDVTDYLDLIVDLDAIEEVLFAFAAYLAEHAGHFDYLDLCNIPEDSPIRERLPVLLEQCGFAIEQTQLDVCPHFAVPDSWDAYLGRLAKKQRHELRRKMRRAHGATEQVDWYIVGPEQDIETEIDRFVDLMAASDREKEAFLQDANNVAFFRKIVPLLHEHGWLQLAFLTVNGKPTAAYLNIDYDDRVMVYNSGLQRGGDYDHLSAGIVLLAHLIRHAIKNKVQVFDFLRGDETYKYHLGGEDKGVFALRAYHQSTSGELDESS